MRIAVASDHRGHAAKGQITSLLSELGHEVVDVSGDTTRSCDFTDSGYKGAHAVANGDADMGVLICGSGIGMSITANKLRGIRAALCHDELTAQMSRRHNNANILCLASDVLGEELMRRIVASWLSTEFEGSGRHLRRVRKIEWIEQGKDPSEFASEQ